MFNPLLHDSVSSFIFMVKAMVYVYGCKSDQSLIHVQDSLIIDQRSLIIESVD